MYRLTTLTSIVALTFCGCVQSTNEKSIPKGLQTIKRIAKTLPAGTHSESFALSSGEVLRYTISVPVSFDAAKKTPLIVGLHYGGKVTPHYSRGFVEALLLPGLGELNAVIIAPDSLDGSWSTKANETAVFELMDSISAVYNVDSTKVLLTGFSMGGHGTWSLGSRHQDRFAGLLPVAGAPANLDDVEWRIPVYAINSKTDTVVPIEMTERYLASLDEENRSKIQFAPVEDIPHFHTARFAKPMKEATAWVKEIWQQN